MGPRFFIPPIWAAARTKNPHAGLILDSNNQVIIGGYTYSTDFPLKNALQNSLAGSSDGFLTKLNPSASGNASLVFSTFLGGTGMDSVYGLARDSGGNLYVAGDTANDELATSDAFSNIYAGGTFDGFVAKFDPDAQTKLACTLFGGVDYDRCKALAVDSSGHPYIAGWTYSGDLPTTNGAFQESYTGVSSDGFVAKFLPDLSDLVYATYLGGAEYDDIEAVAVDDTDCAYVAGFTYSSDYPTERAYQTEMAGGEDAVLTKLAPDGASLEFSTYFGGTGTDEGWNMALDAYHMAYVSGLTESTDFPAEAAYQGSLNGEKDGFIFKLGDYQEPGVPEEVSVTVDIPAGTTAAAYKILSMPVVLESPGAEEAIGSRIGTYNTNTMRVGYWNAERQAYREYPFSANIEPGDSGWFLFRNGKRMTFRGREVTTGPGPMNLTGFTYRIAQGWNQLGNPYTYPIDVADAVVVDGNGNHAYLTDSANTITQRVFWAYKNGRYAAGTGLGVAEGGWVKMLAAGEGSVFFPAVEAATDLDRSPVTVSADLEQPPAPPSALDSSGGSSGGGGGCFIQSLGD